MEKAQVLWSEIIVELQKNYSSDLMEDVFNQCQVIKEENGLIYILVPSTYLKSKINTQFYTNINKLLPKISNEPIRLKFVTKEDLVTQENKYEEKTLEQQEISI